MMLFSGFTQSIWRSIRQVYRSVNRATRGMIGIVILTGKRFDEERGTEAAASLGYYSLFALFPLLILLVVISSFFLEESEIRSQITFLLNSFFPSFTELVNQNLDLIIKQRSIASVTGLIALIWAGSGAFAALARNINRAWRNARPRNIVVGRMFALSLTIIIVLALLIITLFSTVASHLAQLIQIPTETVPVIATASAWFFSYLMFFTLYRWLPKTRVPWYAAGWAAAVATIIWRFATAVFSWLLSSGWANFQVIYGTLGSVIALMLWIYVSSMIALLGAHLSASIASYRRLRSSADE